MIKETLFYYIQFCTISIFLQTSQNSSTDILRPSMLTSGTSVSEPVGTGTTLKGPGVKLVQLFTHLIHSLFDLTGSTAIEVTTHCMKYPIRRFVKLF